MGIGQQAGAAVVVLVAAVAVAVGPAATPAGAAYGEVTVVELDAPVDLARAGTAPLHPEFQQAMVLGPDGAFWVAAQQAQEVVRITTAGEVTRFPVRPEVDGFVYGVSPGPDGNVWFTFSTLPDQGDVPPEDRVGRITPEGEMTLFADTTDSMRSLRGIVEGSDGALWAASAWSGNLFRVETDGSMTRQGLWPNRPAALAAEADGTLLWTGVDQASGWVLDDVGATEIGGATEVHAAPGTLGVVRGPDGDLWTSANTRVTPAGEVADHDSPCRGGAMAVPGDGYVWQAADPAGTGPGDLLCRLEPDGSVRLLEHPGLTTTRAAVVGPDGAVWVLQGGTGGVAASLVRVDVDGIGGPPGAAPPGVRATPGDEQVRLRWLPSFHHDEVGGGYRIYRDGQLVGEVASNVRTFLVSGLENGTSYDFAVSVFDEQGEGPPSAPVAATPAVPPGPPSSLSAVGGVGEVTLAWTPPADDGGDAVSHYRVTRDGSFVVTLPATTTSYVHESAPPGEAGEYRVAAVNGRGVGTASAPGLATARSFSDVLPTHPFFADVEWMAAEGLSTGSPPGPRYLPGAAVSRQAMSAFLYRLAGEPPFVAPGVASFSDVPLDHPFYDEVEWMAAEEISTGYADGTYQPSAAVTRQAMAAFLHRLDDGPGVGV